MSEFDQAQRQFGEEVDREAKRILESGEAGPWKEIESLSGVRKNTKKKK